MIVLEIRFPAGRFHATPWGRHVNEGAVEWPPSPWRLLRSLIATWHLKARGDVTEIAMRGLIASLSSSLPQYQLPLAASSHSRHYMPVVEGKNEKTTKIFDTFIQLDPQDAVLVAWNVTLPPDQFAALSLLAERLGYFGRAESLVVASARVELTPIKVNTCPLIEASPLPADKELVRLLAPMSAADYETWRAGRLTKNEVLEDEPKKSKRKSATSKKSHDMALPADIFEALHADTGTLQTEGWNLPPGAAWFNYVRNANSFTRKPRIKPVDTTSMPTVARYAVVSAVSPRITDAVSIANRVHDALCKWSDQGDGPAQVLSGFEEEGKRFEGHQHSHIFCEANGPRDAITHITVWARMGFDENACLALRRLNKVWGHGGHDIRLVLIGLGDPEAFPDCKLFGKAKTWRSITPFVATRHAKTFRDGRPKIDETNGWQIGSAGHDLLRLLQLNPETAGASIRQEKSILIGEPSDPRSLRCLQFQTTRHGGAGSRGNDMGAAFTITFPKDVPGPIALGYAAHFGLGLFVPAGRENGSVAGVS